MSRPSPAVPICATHVPSSVMWIGDAERACFQSSDVIGTATNKDAAGADLLQNWTVFEGRLKLALQIAALGCPKIWTLSSGEWGRKQQRRTATEVMRAERTFPPENALRGEQRGFAPKPTQN